MTELSKTKKKLHQSETAIERPAYFVALKSPLTREVKSF